MTTTTEWALKAAEHIEKLEADRAALLEALRPFASGNWTDALAAKAREAIKRVEKQT